MLRITLSTLKARKLFSSCLLPLRVSVNYFIFAYSLKVFICVLRVLFNLIAQSYFLEFLSQCERMGQELGHSFRLSVFEYVSMDRSSSIYGISSIDMSLVPFPSHYFFSLSSGSYAFFFFFLGLNPRYMEVPRLGVELELQQPAYTTATETPTFELHLQYTPQLTAMPDP